MQKDLLDEARRLLHKATSICVLTGAGVSAESGVPTFRDKNGLWRNHDPMQLATPEAFAATPALVWEFYNHRRRCIAAVEPNAGHLALAALERRLHDCTLATQNVDRLHQKAGSRNVLELHGDLWTTRCTACGVRQEDSTHDLGARPLCPACGGLLRPNVVWFGELLPQDAWGQALAAAKRCQVMLVAGTSATVQPAASLALMAREHGARVISCNLESTALSKAADIALQGKSGELLPLLLEA